MASCGGLREIAVDSPEVIELTKLILSKLSEGDGKEKTLIEVVKAHRQVVSGTLTHLTLKISDGGESKKYKAKVWEQPWLNKVEITSIELVEGDL